MSLYCVIPARGNSKGIKNKNLLKLKRKSLVENSILQAIKSKSITSITLTSEDKNILDIGKKYKNVHLINRPKKYSNDFIMPDVAVAHALETIINNNKIPKYSCFIQCTSPFLNHIHIDKAFNYFKKNNFDCLFTGFISNKKLWKLKNNYSYPINHNKNLRLGRQYNKNIEVIENGALYIFNTKKFLKLKHRFFGNVGTFVMKEEESIDIDSQFDYDLCRLISKIL